MPPHAAGEYIAPALEETENQLVHCDHKGLSSSCCHHALPKVAAQSHWQSSGNVSAPQLSGSFELRQTLDRFGPEEQPTGQRARATVVVARALCCSCQTCTAGWHHAAAVPRFLLPHPELALDWISVFSLWFCFFLIPPTAVLLNDPGLVTFILREMAAWNNP